MQKKSLSISTKLSIGVIAIIVIFISLFSIITGIFFAKNCENNFYESARVELEEFSDSISMFFDSKKTELNVFAESEQVKKADDSIHSFKDETGSISILDYEKSPVEENIRSLCKSFASNDSDIAEIYLGTEWGGYVTNFDGSMNGGYDPRKRGWYSSANSGKGKIVITDAFASTVGATVVGITRCAYDSNKNFIGNASIEVSLETLTNMLDKVHFGSSGFLMMIQNDGTILADTGNKDNNFKNLSEINIPDLMNFINQKSNSGIIDANGVSYYAVTLTNQDTNYHIVACNAKKAVLKSFYQTLSLIILISLFIAILILVINTFFIRKTFKPISGILASLKGISNNDFTQRITVRSTDELGNVASAFNSTMTSLCNSLSKISGNSNELGEISNELAEDMNNISSEISKIVEGIKKISIQSDELKKGVKLTTDADSIIIDEISKLNENTETQSSCVEQSNASAKLMVNNISQISESISTAGQAADKLLNAANSGKSTMKISAQMAQKIFNESDGLIEASSVILNVASRTNLLAMNAAIEAAHAGESGKGFAVVAGEIRSLAEKCSLQGKVIAESLKELSEEIKNLVDSSKNAEKSFNEIFQLSENVSLLTHNVQNVMTEHKNNCDEILSGINEINYITVNVRNGTDEIYKATKNVARTMTNLNTVTDNLTSSMSEMDNGSKKIAASTDAVNSLSQKNNQMISDLVAEINKFRTR